MILYLPYCRHKLTPPSNQSLKPSSLTREGEDEESLSAVVDFSSRTAIVAAANRGRNAVRYFITLLVLPLYM
jgi:hypothetical protein